MARFTLRLPDALHRQLKERAAKEGVSLNLYMTYLLTREVALDEAMIRAIKGGEHSRQVSKEEVIRTLRGEDANDTEWMNRIVMNPAIMEGKPVIRGTRLPVASILNLLAHGETIASILEEYEGLSEEDIRACLALAAHVLA